MNYQVYGNELYHHGILGQKWGVRRYQNPDGSLTPAGRERYGYGNGNKSGSQTSNKTSESSERSHSKASINTDGAHTSAGKAGQNNSSSETKGLTDQQKKALKVGAAVVGTAVVAAGALYIRNMDNLPMHVAEFNYGDIVDVSSLSSKEMILKKGVTFKRISSKPIEDYVNNGRTYVSYLKKDNRMYKVIMPEFIKKWGKEGVISDDGRKSYEHTLKLNKDIKVASEKTVAELYMKVNGVSEIDSGWYKRFYMDLSDSDNPVTNKFFNEIKELGYDAIIDKNDAGIISKSPLILIEPAKYIEKVKSHPIGNIEKVIDVIRL